MFIKSAKFVSSFTSVSACPETEVPEYAFIGRSNVGKSSLLNYLTGKNGLAKVSQTPGKTQLINFFEINESWHMVDLPGYGYAKTSKKNREEWQQMINQYILKRANLVCLFVLIDSRIPPQDIDMQFLYWLGEHGIPFVIVYTKADRPGASKTQKSLAAIRKRIKKDWEELPPQFVTSSANKEGGDAILEFIQETNEGLS